jgi:hypothetical protein
MSGRHQDVQHALVMIQEVARDAEVVHAITPGVGRFGVLDALSRTATPRLRPT